MQGVVILLAAVVLLAIYSPMCSTRIWTPASATPDGRTATWHKPKQ